MYLYVIFVWRIYIFDNQANKRGILYLKGPFRGISVTVNEDQNVFVLAGYKGLTENCYTVQVFDADGQFVNSFGSERFWRHLNCISRVGSGQIIIFGKWYVLAKRMRSLVGWTRKPFVQMLEFH